MHVSERGEGNEGGEQGWVQKSGNTEAAAAVASPASSASSSAVAPPAEPSLTDVLSEPARLMFSPPMALLVPAIFLTGLTELYYSTNNYYFLGPT